MARITLAKGDDFALKLSQLAAKSDEVAKKAIYEGAKVVADKVKANINALPTDTFRRLKDGEQFVGVPEKQKEDLRESLGITPIDRDDNGDWNAKVGFDGYGRFPTKEYPNGLPNQLLARAIESGSSVRQKKPFVRPAVNAVKKQVEETMGKVIDDEIKKLMQTGGK